MNIVIAIHIAAIVLSLDSLISAQNIHRHENASCVSLRIFRYNFDFLDNLFFCNKNLVSTEKIDRNCTTDSR